MARTPKIKNLCCSPPSTYFKPNGIPVGDLQVIELSAEHLEVLHLCDAQGMYQDAAALKMGVARTTVTRLLAEARQKVALALTEGKALRMTTLD